MATHNSTHKIHEGRNVKRFREMRGWKQEGLADEMGEEWNQRKISLLEQKETIEPDILLLVSTALNIPVEVFQNLDEEQAINVISNTANFDHCQQPSFFNSNPTFNPIDMIVQLHDEKIALYERMLKEKEEMIARLEKLMEGK
ncbi:helix-turn-helix domain-containing protein [Pinibacter aurantiacus]|uniref:Helix-turn-helix domain-containing protein n=1 Tax=Pinibacter aurantiacus TaxID=2851599 RepID=A0A9E2S6D6_9BACT|nr:helix-turn-helix transcriptional regulator [Pinibacter aurantiacus]MBV4355514.1 helix-turn-helix domain-containing protein [Pinibacter aurantiacus]